MVVRPAEGQTAERGRGSGDRALFPPAPSTPTRFERESTNARSPVQRVPYVCFLLPALNGYGINCVYPTIRAFYLSLFDWTGVGPIGGFIGLQHFGELLRSDCFWT